MKPIDYESVISECTLALQVQPQFVRALLRRARAFEAVEVEGCFWTSSGSSAGSTAALGASAVRGAPIAGLGPCLPARPASKKGVNSAVGSVVSPNSKTDKSQNVLLPNENGPEIKTQSPKVVLKPFNNGSAVKPNSKNENQKDVHRQISEVAIRCRPLKLVYD
ncbi:putative heat shock protein 70 (HSP70)-interacting protein, partial [Trifolium medium]|nr:putative heat shock protein 70 (HSP70)-interacting protein [Trifolium medium]